MKKLYLFLTLGVAAIIAVGVFIAWRAWTSSPPPQRTHLEPARISEIRSMVELQTVDFYREVPFKASIGPRHLVGRITLEGSIGFDLEKVSVSERGDTIDVTLPSASVTVLESTHPEAYKIYDSWSDRPFGKSGFSNAEENEVKRRIVDKEKSRLLSGPAAVQARNDALKAVAQLLANSTGRPVTCR